jgi:nicotinamide-nucleotide amidase
MRELQPFAVARDCVTALIADEATVAVAESLTGGLVAGALTDVPGVSAVLRGAVVSYATDLKAALLGVAETLLAERGPVDADVALAMAAGVARVCGATYGVATTGVAGPGPQDGVAAGTAYIAVVSPAATVVRRLDLLGDRAQVRAQCVQAVLELLLLSTREHIEGALRWS